MIQRAMLFALPLLGGLSPGLLSAQPLVDADWLATHSCDEGVVVVDIRPDGEVVKESHVPCAVHAPYPEAGWRVERDDIPGQLPPTEELAKLIGGLGIDNDSHVVIYSPGFSSSDTAAGTRVYWTFKVIGHDNVSLLDGGFAHYQSDMAGGKRRPLTTHSETRRPTAKRFEAALQADLLATRAEVKSAIDQGVSLVDHRPADMYLGINRHPAAPRSGTLPTAGNVPERWLTENAGGQFRSKEVLSRLFETANVPTSGPQINFCNTGHWASIGWFVSHELLGNKEAKLYDGSMVEWSRYDELPIEQKIKLTQ